LPTFLGTAGTFFLLDSGRGRTFTSLFLFGFVVLGLLAGLRLRDFDEVEGGFSALVLALLATNSELPLLSGGSLLLGPIVPFSVDWGGRRVTSSCSLSAALSPRVTSSSSLSATLSPRVTSSSSISAALSPRVTSSSSLSATLSPRVTSSSSLSAMSSSRVSSSSSLSAALSSQITSSSLSAALSSSSSMG
uniref:Na_H_Exchanger domain-containing protein n=1 Tax=Haemonchus placei TaxID=6290 RepID=A0A0N4X8H0_HAEPC